VTLANHRFGKNVTGTLKNQPAICLASAEWIVEDLTFTNYAFGPGPFANFSAIKFANASATTASGQKVGPGSASVMDIKQGETLLPSSSATASSVTVSFFWANGRSVINNL
jgi:hypothetical protein